MDSYSEAAPEGLWDAISRKRAARKRAAVWWYSAGGLLAAAAVAALALLLWPVSPEPSLPAEQALIAESSPAVQSGEQPALEETAPEEELFFAEKTVPAQEQADTEKPAFEEEQPVPEKPIPAGVQPDTEATTPVPESSTASETADSEQQPSFPAATEDPSGPAATVPLRKSRRARPGSVQIRVSSGSYLAQAAGSTTTGYGLPDFPGIRTAPGTKATGGSSSGVAQMLSRNKASTTTSQHTQSARLAFLLHYDTGTRWGMETGLTRTTLQSSFDTESGTGSSHTDRTLQYTGIPLYFTFRALEWKRISGYLSAGPMYEFCTGGNNVTSSYMSGMMTSTNTTPLNYSDHKWSLNTNAGQRRLRAARLCLVHSRRVGARKFLHRASRLVQRHLRLQAQALLGYGRLMLSS